PRIESISCSPCLPVTVLEWTEDAVAHTRCQPGRDSAAAPICQASHCVSVLWTSCARSSGWSYRRRMRYLMQAFLSDHREGTMMRPLKLLMLLGVLVGTGCSIFESEDPADTARVRLTGTSPVDLELITSSDFAFNIDPQTGRRESVLVESDTVLVRPPYEQAFDIAEFGIFLVRLTNAE